MAGLLQIYKVKGHNVYVYRADLYAQPPLPAIAKVQGLEALIKHYASLGINNIGVYDTRISRTGLATAIICNRYKIPCTIYYPVFAGQWRGDILPQHREALKFGAFLYPIQVTESQYDAIPHYEAAYDLARLANITLLPYGLNHPLVLAEYVKQANDIPIWAQGGVLIMAVGSGTALQGVLKGLKEPPTHIFGILIGGDPIFAVYADIHVFLKSTPYHYYEQASEVTPFTCDAYYDLKAWEWLTNNVAFLPKPVLFYNLG